MIDSWLALIKHPQYKWWGIWGLSVLLTGAIGVSLYHQQSHFPAIVVAQKDLQTGHVLQPQDLALIPWHEERIPADALTNVAPLLKHLLTAPVYAGMPISKKQITPVVKHSITELKGRRLISLSVPENNLDRVVVNAGDTIDLWFLDDHKQTSNVIENVTVNHLSESKNQFATITLEVATEQLGEFPNTHGPMNLRILMHPHAPSANKQTPMNRVEIIRNQLP